MGFNILNNYGPNIDVHDGGVVNLRQNSSGLWHTDDAVEAAVVEDDVREGKEDPYEALLMEMIEPIRKSGKWREILMPYHAAVVERVLPKWSHKIFVEKTGLNVSSSSYSLCMSDGSYTPDEMEPYSEKFAQLKRQLDNSK